MSGFAKREMRNAKCDKPVVAKGLRTVWDGPAFFYPCGNAGGNALAHPAYTAVEMVGSNGFPADGAYAQGTVYACLRHCELHVAYASPQMPIIPNSVQQRLSSFSAPAPPSGHIACSWALPRRARPSPCSLAGYSMTADYINTAVFCIIVTLTADYINAAVFCIIPGAAASAAAAAAAAAGAGGPARDTALPIRRPC
jgi:hypothetical protein